jgi:hypothetical protein
MIRGLEPLPRPFFPSGYRRHFDVQVPHQTSTLSGDGRGSPREHGAKVSVHVRSSIKVSYIIAGSTDVCTEGSLDHRNVIS